jgi:phenylacetaldehyde dehydrogenase
MPILDYVDPQTVAARALIEQPSDHPMLIGGEWRAATDGGWIDTLDPATGRRIGRIAAGGVADVDAAVRAARTALDGAWGRMVPAERAAILSRVADLVEAEIDALAEIESLDQGKPLGLSRWGEIPGVVAQFRFFAGLVPTIEGRTVTPSITYQPAGREVHAWTLREPVGVVGAIVPWNSPLILATMKIAPALAAGCTIVLKPAENTSLTALRLGALLDQAGLPKGVFNVVTGLGSVAGAALAAHPGVDKIAFTGSTETGRAIVRASAGNLKRVTLELGGKSPALVLADAELELAIPGVANAIFGNGGQVCVANARVYIHETIFDAVVEGIAAQGAAMALGHQLNPGTGMGPLVSTAQAARVQGFVDEARRAGASILCGGERLGSEGTFIAPTIVAEVGGDLPIAREEVFGPVLVAHRFTDLDAALAEADDSDYGLAASVWTQSFSHAHRISRRLKAGTVWINTHSLFDASLAIGGVKQSGYGRDSGTQALDNYLEWKTVCAVL